jgi:hypothetical protein
MADNTNSNNSSASSAVEESTKTSTVNTVEVASTQVVEATQKEVNSTSTTETKSVTEEKTIAETQPVADTDNTVVDTTKVEDTTPTVNSTITEVRKVIADESIGDMRARLRELVKNGPTVAKLLLAKLLGYADAMSATVIDSKIGAGRNYDLYNTLIGVLAEEDQAMFKLKFDIVNLVFKEYRSESFNDVKLHRFDKEWPRDTTTLNTYQNLVTVITALCDLNDRVKQMKLISFDKAFDITTTTFTPDMISAVKRYYS